MSSQRYTPEFKDEAVRQVLYRIEQMTGVRRQARRRGRPPKENSAANEVEAQQGTLDV